MTESSKRILNQIKETVNGIDPSAEIILYGSRARNTEREESDWDVLIITEGKSGFGQERKIRHKLFDLELEIGQPISIRLISRDIWENRKGIIPFYLNITSEGVSV